MEMPQIFTYINEAWGQISTPLKTKRRYALNQYIHLNQVFTLILTFATAFILKFLQKQSLLHKGRFFVTEILKKQPLSCAALVASRMLLLLIVIMGRITTLRVFSLQKARCRIRPCSEQILSNGLCFKLQVGDVVAASRVPHNRSGNPPQLLYDASIQKVALIMYIYAWIVQFLASIRIYRVCICWYIQGKSRQNYVIGNHFLHISI